jgi:hypothetical protein
MSLKEWGIVTGAQILGNYVALIVALVAGAVIFVVGYITLAAFGLVSAVIYGLFGFGIVWAIGTFSAKTLKKHWQIVLIIPGLFFFGLISDRISQMSMLSWVPMIDRSTMIAQNDIMQGGFVTLYGPYLVGAILLVVAFVVGAVMYLRRKKRRH